MKIYFPRHRIHRNLAFFLLAILFFFTGLDLELSSASANTATQISQLNQSLIARRKKRRRRKHKKRRKRRRKKRTKARSKKQVIAMLPFSADGGGLSMVQAVTGQLGNVQSTDAYQVEMALTPGPGRFSPASIKAALKATGGTVLLRGIGHKNANNVVMRVYLFDHRGRLRWKKQYQSQAGERDPLALAPEIGTDLKKILAHLDMQPAMQDPESRERDVTFSASHAAQQNSDAPEQAQTQKSTASAKASDRAETSEDSTQTKNAAQQSYQGQDKTSSGLHLSAAVAGDLLFWSYQLHSAQFDNNIYAHPLDPYLGTSLALDWRPFDWLQIDSDLHLGQHSFDTSNAPIDQSQVRITAVNFGLSARARYMLAMGLGFGGHLAYRLTADWASEQSPVTVATNMMQHSFLPGLDLYYEALAPWLLLRTSLAWAPLGIYTETPVEPGANAQMWGWRADLAARTNPWMGLFVELRAFSENAYVQYSGEGERQDLSGHTITDAAIQTSLHGLSLGLGWTF